MARVLLVEDDSSWMDIYRRYCNIAGVELHSASSFDQAVSILHGKKKFDLIIFDLILMSTGGKSAFTWLDALIYGMKAEKLDIPPIIICTGMSFGKKEIIRLFTKYQGKLYGFFEKSTFDFDEFTICVRSAINPDAQRGSTAKSSLRLFATAIFMSIIVLFIFGVLLFGLNKISDPLTQQTFLKVGSALVIVIAVFIAVFNQNAKIEDVIAAISKIWRD